MSVNNMLKCTNCNVAILELINESLIRICVSAFSEEDIDVAKKLFFSSTKTSKNLIYRHEEKKQKDLDHMISIFKTIDPDQLPIYVAYDLHKL